jgi:hypothetical protein
MARILYSRSARTWTWPGVITCKSASWFRRPRCYVRFTSAVKSRKEDGLVFLIDSVNISHIWWVVLAESTRNILFDLYTKETCICRRPGCLYKRGRTADWKTQSIYLSKYIYLLRFITLSFVLLCHALAALEFGSSLPFCAEKRSISSTKARNLCCFARKAIGRRHESTTTILVLRSNFVCQHNWRLRWGRRSTWWTLIPWTQAAST